MTWTEDMYHFPTEVPQEKILKCYEGSIAWEEEEQWPQEEEEEEDSEGGMSLSHLSSNTTVGSWIRCGCEATELCFDEFDFLWRTPATASDEEEEDGRRVGEGEEKRAPYLDASVGFSTEQLMRWGHETFFINN